MSQVMPPLGYPGGRSAFFADLHLDFPRWLRLIALVPLVHASIEGLSHEELCFHILSILPSSNPSSVLIVSADCMRSSVAEMLFNEPFFVVRLPLPAADLRFLISSPFNIVLTSGQWIVIVIDLSLGL
jgi:hypothetical protein